VEEQPPPLNTYTSGIGNCIQALPKHVQRLVGNIPTLAMPTVWETTEPKYLIVATDGSVLFGVRYQSWVIATADEEILLTGCGPDDGHPLLMTSYQLDVGGLSAGLTVVGTLARSDIINIPVKCVCDNKSSILQHFPQNRDGL
jgi:hypothetical protein